MKLKKNIYVLCILVTLAGMFFSCENSQKELEKITFDESHPDEKTTNIVLFFSDSAKTKVKLTAPLLHRYHDSEKPYTEFPNGFEVIFYDNKGAKQSFIKANMGKFFQNTNKMEAYNDVVVINAKGDKLNTEELHWDQEKKKIYSEEFVKITTEEEIIYGNGLEADEDFSNYSIKHVKGIVTLDEEIEEEDEELQ